MGCTITSFEDQPSIGYNMGGDPPGPGAYIELRVGSGPSLHGTHPTPRWGRGQISAASFCHKVNAEVMTDEEREMRAGREKNKGNKAFKAGDFEEALAYYSRSISLIQTTASINNRVLAYHRLEKWEDVRRDCDEVLMMEEDNLKAKFENSIQNDRPHDRHLRAHRPIPQRFIGVQSSFPHPSASRESSALRHGHHVPQVKRQERSRRSICQSGQLCGI
ncbi:unnamed protein product [Clavelina lepadiformis]|uniref:Uncharacterized protein n=1 Tax=Clavelina lepadiformis TaxID=159417 RepID=A0ABP0G6U1_CLALP